MLLRSIGTYLFLFHTVVSAVLTVAGDSGQYLSAYKEVDYESPACLATYSFSALVNDASGKSETVTGENTISVTIANYQRPLNVTITYEEDPTFIAELHYAEGETESQFAGIKFCPDQD